MPLKWKIYYACNLYLLIWCTAIAGFVIYAGLAPNIRMQSPVVIPIFLCILSIIAAKASFGMRYLFLYNKGYIYSNIGKIVFNILYGIVLVFSVLSAIVLVTQMPKDLQSNGSNIETLLDLGLLVATMCCIYISIMSPSLVTAIRKNYHSNIETVGQDIHT